MNIYNIHVQTLMNIYDTQTFMNIYGKQIFMNIYNIQTNFMNIFDK